MAEFTLRLVNIVFYKLWQILPIDIASGIGSFLIRFISRKYYRTTAATKTTLLRINPDLSAEELDRLLFNMWQNIGRVWAESLITQRLARQRLKITGIEHITSAMDPGKPVIVPFLHIGNWEIIIHVLDARGAVMNSIGEVQKGTIFDNILNRTRASNKLKVINPDFEGKRKIYQSLRRGEMLGIALDEYKNGKVWGPRFGRKFSESTNMDYLLRLAIKFNAVLLPIYLTRLEGVNFQMHVSPPVSPDSLQDNAGIAHVRQGLENWSESTIRAHIDQWYMLHHLRF
ncbi:MAG: hypothetical protein HW386_2042 [Gammaproteobacteria bacterium]|nr:hypothetical protein [Gammaproteobacteria bacterium]